MKYIIAVLLFFPFALSADPQIDEQQHHCHFPYDPENQDNEYYEYCEASIRANQDGTVTGSSVVIRKYAFRNVPENRRIFLSGSETGFTCNLTDDNGNTFSTDDWDVRIKPRKRLGFMRFDIECRNAEQN